MKRLHKDNTANFDSKFGDGEQKEEDIQYRGSC